MACDIRHTCVRTQEIPTHNINITSFIIIFSCHLTINTSLPCHRCHHQNPSKSINKKNEETVVYLHPHVHTVTSLRPSPAGSRPRH